MVELEALRTKTGELLDEGLQSGSLTTEEHAWRTKHLGEAQSVDQLEALVEDLLTPVTSSNLSQVTILSNRNYRLSDLGRRSELVTILGSTRISLVGWENQALTLELVTIMGDVVVEVPPGMRVRVDCTPILGDCRVDPKVQDSQSEVRLTGVLLLGSLRVVSRGAADVRR